jgi:hypothetical protein
LFSLSFTKDFRPFAVEYNSKVFASVGWRLGGGAQASRACGCLEVEIMNEQNELPNNIDWEEGANLLPDDKKEIAKIIWLIQRTIQQEAKEFSLEVWREGIRRGVEAAVRYYLEKELEDPGYRDLSPEIRKRRKKVSEYWLKGLTRKESAMLLNYHPKTIQRDEKALGLSRYKKKK